jgi:hypothetical protein
MRRLAAPALACIVLLAAFVTGGCELLPPNATLIPAEAARLATAPPVADLGKVEVREYRGKRLDAISSAR